MTAESELPQNSFSNGFRIISNCHSQTEADVRFRYSLPDDIDLYTNCTACITLSKKC